MSLLNKIKNLWAAWKNHPCDCHGCMPMAVNQSRSMNVSHGLHMSVRDGKVHYRRKSRHIGSSQ